MDNLDKHTLSAIAVQKIRKRRGLHKEGLCEVVLILDEQLQELAAAVIELKDCAEKDLLPNFYTMKNVIELAEEILKEGRDGY